MTRAVEALMRWAGPALGLTQFTIHVQAEDVSSVAITERRVLRSGRERRLSTWQETPRVP